MNVLTAVDKYDAIAQQGDSTTSNFYIYTAEPGWSAYGICDFTVLLGSDSDDDSGTAETTSCWVHSSEGLVATAYLYDDDYPFLALRLSDYPADYQGTSTGYDITSDDDDDDDDDIEITLPTQETTYSLHLYVADSTEDTDSFIDLISASDDITDYMWQAPLQLFAGKEWSEDDQDYVDADISDLTILDFIVEDQIYSPFTAFIKDVATDSSGNDISEYDQGDLINPRDFILSESGKWELEFFATNHPEGTAVVRLAGYIRSRYCKFIGSPFDIVHPDLTLYGGRVPDNLWPCDGSEITNVNAIPQLYGKNAPTMNNMVIAGCSSTYAENTIDGADSVYIGQKNLPTLEGSVTMSYTPEGTVSISDSGHKHNFNSKWRYMYKVLRDSDDVDDDIASDNGNSLESSTHTGQIETGHDDNFTFYWDQFTSDDTDTDSAKTGISATFAGTEATLTGTTLLNEDLSNYTAVDVRQATVYKQFYIVIY